MSLVLFSKDKWVLHLECNLLLRGCLEFPCITLPPRLPSFKSFPLHPSQLHSFNSHRPKAIAQKTPSLPKESEWKACCQATGRSSQIVMNIKKQMDVTQLHSQLCMVHCAPSLSRHNMPTGGFEGKRITLTMCTLYSELRNHCGRRLDIFLAPLPIPQLCRFL